MPDGLGNFFFLDGKHYHGQFQKGMMNGTGYLFSLFQNYYKGAFKDNKKSGKGIKAKSDGKVYDQIWMNGKFIIEFENEQRTIYFQK